MNLTIYRNTTVVITRKIRHQKYSALYKKNKRKGIGFCKDFGDIPAIVIDDQYKSIPVVNTRGLAYAHRNALKYKKPKKYVPEISFD